MNKNFFKNLQNQYQFNMLGIENFYTSKKYKKLFNFIKNNHNSIKGDICEFGVFNGHTILSIAILLKMIGSNKKVYGFDSFQGFSKKSFCEQDSDIQFDKLYKKKEISKDHYNKVLFRRSIKKINFSSSGNFTNTSIQSLYYKIKKLNLNNIKIIKGDFSKTLPPFFKQKKNIFACNIDCDLYESYKITLPYVWQNLSKGGFIHLDEYYSIKYPGAKIATDNFLKLNSITVKKFKDKNDDFFRYFLIKKK